MIFNRGLRVNTDLQTDEEPHEQQMRYSPLCQGRSGHVVRYVK